MNTEYPAIILWRGIRFEQVTPERDEPVRYRSDFSSPFNGATLWLWNSKQWGAKFRGGSYSIAYSMEEALIEAAAQARRMILSDARSLENLIYNDGDS